MAITDFYIKPGFQGGFTGLAGAYNYGQDRQAEQQALGQQQQEQEQANIQRQEMGELTSKAAGGDVQALSDLYKTNPEMAMKIGERNNEKIKELGAVRAMESKKAETNWLIKMKQATTPEAKQALMQEALADDMIDIDEDDIDLDNTDLMVNTLLFGHLGKDAYKELLGGGGYGDATAKQKEFNSNIKMVKNDPELKTVEGKAAAISLGLEPRAAITREERIAQNKELAALVVESESRLEGGKSKAREEAKIAPELRKQTQKQNMTRLNELKTGEKQRSSTIKKAQRFLKAFKGSQDSGATRTALSFFPGTFTDQAQFDEAFNAFSEVAAREKLKASGETRPTDADVEGMKRAMFGVGRDEVTNVDLLIEFIDDMGDLDIELDELRDAKSRGSLDTFDGVPKFLSNDDMLKKYLKEGS